jgi:peptidoglycan/xylan/chitin deacetylase (PgdA/CDA1 family)
MTTGRAALLAATAAAVALATRSLLGAAVPLWLAVAAFFGYAGLVTWGVLSPAAEMFADVVWRGPDGAKGIALTFDDGPHPEFTRSVLESLDRAGMKATFFVIGEKAVHQPDVLREIVAAGHSVGVHGHRHDRALSFRSLARVRADLARSIELVEAATGARPTLYRPAVGQTNPRIARAAADLGLTLVGWTVRARDGIRAAPERVASRVIARLRHGAIVLLHDAAEKDDREPAAPKALPRILEAMRARKMPAVRVDDWLRKD